MMIKNYSLGLNTEGFCHVVDITDQVQERIVESGVSTGTVTLFVVGSTAGITTVEYEPGCVKDLEELFNKLAPPSRSRHTSGDSRQNHHDVQRETDMDLASRSSTISWERVAIFLFHTCALAALVRSIPSVWSQQQHPCIGGDLSTVLWRLVG